MASTWRKAFDAWEKAVAPGLEDLTASQEFRDAMAMATKLNAAAKRQIERNSSMWLHAFNLPTATDIRTLRRQLSSLENQVAALRRATEKAGGHVPSGRAAKLAEIDRAIAAAKNGTATNGALATAAKDN